MIVITVVLPGCYFELSSLPSADNNPEPDPAPPPQNACATPGRALKAFGDVFTETMDYGAYANLLLFGGAGIQPVGGGLASPTQPCILSYQEKGYKRLATGFCVVGKADAYFALDTLGNVRACNHSPEILGNIFHQSFTRMAKSKAMQRFLTLRRRCEKVQTGG